MLNPSPTIELQRAQGRAHLGFALRNGKTVLTDLHQSGCVKALLPANHASRPDAVLINTAGGVTGGDALTYSASLEEQTSLCLTTQTAERIYKSSSGVGRISTRLELGPSSSLDWLPQETILFDGCALDRKLDVIMHGSSRALLLEPVILGRKAMGEILTACCMSDQWRIIRDGTLIYADALRITDPRNLNSKATLDGMNAFATLVYIAPEAEERLDSMRRLLDFDNVHAAASAWNGCLVTRFISSDAQALRAALIKTLSRFRAHPLPRVWLM
ncbi:urease accessory protein UreD [Coralliovum pocilloporae]|uniref:urease accessory protein UreD n=1 Tax=Coralliovum pocilloporae TaxID=3066369 RepID=UPI0033078BFD